MTSQWSDATSLDNPSAVKQARGLNASAVATTFVLNSSKFDSGATCTVNSWTTVDLTAQTGDYWHVDDFAQTNSLGSLAGPITPNGITFTPVQGSKPAPWTRFTVAMSHFPVTETDGISRSARRPV
jgi:hypothetical protein